ncbi:enoyl-CoA hydratase-related protein [Brevibacterium album]|uniref:enoyl-CoA hydratase-related protein n=1 Tax=Brevibacterium album TaxID=417948 RepID=UPI00041B2980|nr:enoyl-CoA hydratase-related protein [Brevibacterium album]
MTTTPAAATAHAPGASTGETSASGAPAAEAAGPPAPEAAAPEAPGAGPAASEAASPQPDAVRTAPAGTVRIETYGPVAHVVLDRPDTMNSVTPDVMRDLIAAGRELSTDATVNAVVLRGEGRAFCAGLDMGQFKRLAEGGAAGEPEDAPTVSKALAQQAVEIWSHVPVPVIACLHGPVLGAGFQFALGADIRISSPDARLGLMEVVWGIVPDMLGTQLLPRLVGPSKAKHLIFTSDMISGEQALAWGVVDEVAQDPLVRAHALAAQIADQSRPALVAAKRLVDLSAHASLADGAAAEQEQLSTLKGTDEQRAAIAKRMAHLRERKERKRAQS